MMIIVVVVVVWGVGVGLGHSGRLGPEATEAVKERDGRARLPRGPAIPHAVCRLPLAVTS